MLSTSDVVLYIDDDEDDRMIMSTVFENKPYLTLRLFDKHEPFFSYLTSTSDPIRLILLDINMPRKNGLDIAKEIKGLHPGLAQLPLVFLTTGVNSPQSAELRHLGFRVVEKPSLLTRMAELIDQLLEQYP